MKSLLENTVLVFGATIVAGLFLPQLSESVAPYITALLVVAMSLSLREIVFTRKDMTENASSSLKAFLIGYGLQSSLILTLAYFLVPDPSYFAGFVIIAAMPPAVYVVPFTFILKGDMKVSLGGQVTSYLLALLMAPLITILFLGLGVNVLEIMSLLLILIILPLIISFALKHLPKKLFSGSKSVVNICLALVIYSIIGLNQSVIISDPVNILPSVLVLATKTFILGSIVYCVASKVCTPKERAISYTLFASFKSIGTAAAFAIVLVGSSASLPAALGGIVELLFLMFFQRLVKKKICTCCSVC